MQCNATQRKACMYVCLSVCVRGCVCVQTLVCCCRVYVYIYIQVDIYCIYHMHKTQTSSFGNLVDPAGGDDEVRGSRLGATMRDDRQGCHGIQTPRRGRRAVSLQTRLSQRHHPRWGGSKQISLAFWVLWRATVGTLIIFFSYCFLQLLCLL